MKNRKHLGLHGLTQLGTGGVNRYGYIGLMLVAFALMLLGKADVVVMERVRAHVIDGVSPILDVLSRPVASMDRIVEEITALRHLRDENEKLKIENQNLLEWQSAARKLSKQNDQLKSLLNFAPMNDPYFVSGRIIGDTGGAFVHSVLVNAGKREGIAKGQAVITGNGLVGRVQGVGVRSSRVLLISDLNSRIPVVVEASRTRAVLAGDNTDHPRLIHMPPGAIFVSGDRIVTSGHGGAFPAGIPVGMVSTTKDGNVLVKPYVQRERLEYVRVVDYGLKGILETMPSQKHSGKAK